MDARRLLILAAAGLSLAACSTLPHLALRPAAPGPIEPAKTAEARSEPTALTSPTAPLTSLQVEARAFATMDPIPNPQRRRPARPATAVRTIPQSEPGRSGRAAIAAANASALATSRSRAFLGGVQVFVYDPGRVYEVWTAPLRVTTLTLSPGETIISKAAGDTVRWQIGETQSGEGPGQRAHVMIKPLQRGLETNLVL
ncbi:TrbG/VirB9 family P-type conjugative transfer protein, partial [Phenylobacterium sp.]|uniref:TrbG/VirB9 family P-type conjugative transfer protein n=1 Tax=Phenylobacterium sp. TaxID=1871053 RepID=UPI0025EB7C80